KFFNRGVSFFVTYNVYTSVEYSFLILFLYQERLRGNIDALDYLRGISGLEKPFTHLVEEILRTALVMSQENNVSYPQAVYGHNMNEKVDRCWTYINQLTDTVHWHVQHAVRFHKFHHDMKTAQWELTHLTEQSNKSLKELETAEMLSMEQLEQTDRIIEHLLVSCRYPGMFILYEL
ncbi:hypothetical protein AHF37_11885, partial [Paragonimus kellicotti]